MPRSFLVKTKPPAVEARWPYREPSSPHEAAPAPSPPAPCSLAVRYATGYLSDVLSPALTSSSESSDLVSSNITTSTPLSPPQSPSEIKNLETPYKAAVTVSYTYDAFFVSDGRSRRKNNAASSGSERGRYTCSECGKQYATSSNLSRHKQTHRSPDSQLAKRCPTCGKVYVSMPALAMHVLTHTLNHRCETCGKAFSRPWLLQGHMRSHTGEKPFGCAHCGKAFADRSNLRAHMQTHSSLKHYRCQRCNKSFALKSYLNKHYESSCFKETAGIIPELLQPQAISS